MVVAVGGPNLLGCSQAGKEAERESGEVEDVQVLTDTVSLAGRLR